MQRQIDKIKFPSDWNKTKISSIGKVYKGKGISKSEVIESGLPCIRYGEIYTVYNYKFSDTRSFINNDSASLSQPICFGDILFAGSGETAEEIGKAVTYVGSDVAFAGGDIVILRPNEPKSGLFLGYYLNSNFINQQKAQSGQGHSVVHLYGKNVEVIDLVIPPLHEQQKIATILSKWDETIETQTQLIEAKEKQKRGLMQKLLTGEVRFPGFEEDWETKSLNEILTIGGGRDYKHLGKGEIPVYGTGGYMTSVDQYLIDGETVCIGRKGTIDVPKYFNGKIWTVDTLFYCHSFKHSDAKFIFYLFQSINWKEYNEASGVPSLSKSTIGAIEVRVPIFEEQLKIASVLTTLDDEIQNYKNELDALKLQKKGLMQELLTGKIRVKA